MSTRDKSYADSYDFLLVTTYIPVISLCIRAIGFIFIINWLTVTLWLPWHVVVIFGACVVYIDACTMTSYSMDRTCGYLCMCALAVLAQPNAHLPTSCTGGTAMFVTGQNFVWSFLSTFEIISCVSGVHVRLPFLAKVVTVSIMALLHASGACTRPGVLEMMCRAVVFYVMCAIAMMSFKFTRVPEHERKNFVAMIPHSFAHLFFVHLYAVLASVLFVVVVVTRLVVQNSQSIPADAPRDEEQAATSVAKRHDTATCKREKRNDPGTARDEREEHAELVRKFMAAKAAVAPV